jgi:hypothetical protein
MPKHHRFSTPSIALVWPHQPLALHTSPILADCDSEHDRLSCTLLCDALRPLPPPPPTKSNCQSTLREVFRYCCDEQNSTSPSILFHVHRINLKSSLYLSRDSSVLVLDTLSLSATRVARAWCQFKGSCGARWVRCEGLTCGCFCYKLRVKQRNVNFWGSEITIAGKKNACLRETCFSFT